jgi:hypothetical protein
MTLIPNLRIVVACFAAVGFSGSIAQGSILNIADDFGNSAFSYGYETSLGGTLNPYTVTDSTTTPGVTALLQSGTFPGFPPYVGHNTTGAPLNLGFATLPADTLDMHPGQNGEYTVVRFTASAGGSYAITGLFSDLDNTGTTTDVHILLNGISIFSGAINGVGTTAPFNLTETLAASDTVDFLVGFGSNGNFFNDSTGLAGTISTSTTAPEPGSIGLLGAGLLAIATVGGFRSRGLFARRS